MVAWTQTTADHVSEREVGTWEDCVPASGVEFVRAGMNDRAKVPATNAEREALRAAMGLPEEHHGATLAQLGDGIKARYGLIGWRIVRDWPTILSHLSRAGTVAVITGDTSALPVHYKHGYSGPHGVFTHGRGSTTSCWWCDPLMATGTYRGETIPLTALRAFFLAYPGAGAMLAEVGGLHKEETVAVYVRENKTGTFVVPAGYTVNRRELTDAGMVKAGQFGPVPTPATFHFEAVLTRVVEDPIDPALTTMLLGSDGFFDGYYVSPTVVQETYDPPPPDTTPFDQDDLDAATKQGHAAGVDDAAAAVAAVPR